MKRNLLLKSVALKIRRQTTKAKLENSLAVRPKDRACPSRSDIFFVVVAMLLVTGNLVFGQQWVGPNTATSPIYRIGKVGIGATNPRNPLAIRGTGLYQDLISFEDPFGITKFHLTLNVGGNNPGLNFAETNVADARLFIRAGGNIGIGPRRLKQSWILWDQRHISFGYKALVRRIIGSSFIMPMPPTILG